MFFKKNPFSQSNLPHSTLNHQHTKWVLEIGRILARRGHNITFITRDDQLHIADAFLEITAVSTGGPVYYQNPLEKVQGKNFYQVAKIVRQFLNDAYQTDMKYYRQLFNTSSPPDYFICDAFNEPCIDTAYQLNIPSAITCTGILHQETSVPYINSLGTTAHATSEHMALWERFHHKYIDLIKIIWHLYPEMKALDRYRLEFGIPAAGLNRYKKWENALKLVNSYFGFMPTQVLGPLTHMVGPVLSSKQKELNKQETEFLDAHTRVGYVAFGQVVQPNKREIEVLLSALLDQIERKQLDGFIWVGLKKHVERVESQINGATWQLNTSSSTNTYKAPLLSNKDVLSPSQVFIPNWSSQFAILAHPSTALFVSHGGAESANEATFNGVPILVNPYFGDQRIVGRALTIAGIARVYEREFATFDLVKSLMDDLLLDPHDTVKNNVSRMQILAQIGSKRKSFAADLVGKVIKISCAVCKIANKKL